MAKQFTIPAATELTIPASTVLEVDSTDVWTDPVSDYLFKYKFDGTDSSLTRTGTDDYRLAPAAPEALCNWQDGATQYWNSTDGALVQVGTGAYSFSFWFNVNSATNQCIINTGAGGGTNNFRIRIDGANGLLRNRTSGVIVGGSTNVVDGKWHHAVFTSAGSEGTYTWYLDGVADGTGSMPVYNYNTGVSLQVGHRSNSQIPNGAIDDIRFYDRVLSVGEMTALKNYRNDWTYEQITTVAVYDPSDISASNITELAGAVSALSDKGTSGALPLAQGTGASQPTTGTRDLNGLNVLDYNEDFLTRTDAFVPVSGDIAIYSVHVIDSVDNAADSLHSTFGDFTNDWQFDARNASQFNGGVFSPDDSLIFSGGPYSGAVIAGLVFDLATSSTVKGYMDSVLRDSGTYTTTLSTGSVVFRLMSNRGGVNNVIGAAGIVIITEDLTDATRQKIEGFFAWVYGLTANLDASHPYKTTPPKRLG